MKIYKDPKVNWLYVGAPGIGKTEQITEAFGKENVVVLLASSMVEEDIAGIPFNDNGKEGRLKPKFLSALEAIAERGEIPCLFLDELDKARQSVSDTLLTLVAGRHTGYYKIPDNTCIIAAANNQEYSGGMQISIPMASRFEIIFVTPNAGDWCKWFKKQEYYNVSVEAAVMSGAINLDTPPDTDANVYTAQHICPRNLARACYLAWKYPDETPAFTSNLPNATLLLIKEAYTGKRTNQSERSPFANRFRNTRL